MRSYLSRSISSLNRNKLNGILAEIDFRNHLRSLGYAERVSPGGWICRCDGAGNFGHHTVAFFPAEVLPEEDYHMAKDEEPPRRLHTICATLHQIGIHSYYCMPAIGSADDPESLQWYMLQLGVPSNAEVQRFPFGLVGFNERSRKYKFLRYRTDVAEMADEYVPDQFSKEHVRISFQNAYMGEVSDIDGILWGQQHTYPIEIKEKTAAEDRRLGEFFGLDVGPFVKLAFYAAKRGNLHSIFVVREINNPVDRRLVNWWFITYEKLAQFASWVPLEGGRAMTGSRSSTIRIPKSEFTHLTEESLAKL
jgi:hypothetical protein